MAPIPETTFVRALRGLSAPELAAFVADLWSARGWEVRVEGPTVVARDGGTTRRLLAAPRGRRGRVLPAWLPRPGRAVPGAAREGHDAVVVRSPATDDVDGVRVIDGTELRAMALYAVDPGTRDRLFARHLGRPATVEVTAKGYRRRSAPVVASVLLLVVAAAVGVVAYDLPGAEAPSASTAGDQPGTPAPELAEDPPTGTATGSDGPGGAPNATGGPYPFGASPYGVESAERLARSHAIALAPRSYRWRISYREVVDGRVRGYVNETVWVENATVYRSDVDRVGDVRFAPIIIPTVSTYANGSVRFDRVEDEDGVRYRRHVLGTRAPLRRPFEDDPYDVIRWYLSTRQSWLVGSTERNGTRYHRFAGRGDTWPRTTGIRATATVDEFGVVHRLRRTHLPPDSDARVVVTFRVTGVGNTTVTPPPWLGDARRATASATTG